MIREHQGAPWTFKEDLSEVVVFKLRHEWEQAWEILGKTYSRNMELRCRGRSELDGLQALREAVCLECQSEQMTF